MTTGGATRHAFWMRTPTGWRASWLHLPLAGRRRACGVVICAPMGHEYVHSYRTLLHLADRLAAAGILTLRFDYHGCGSSSGDPLDAELVGAWVEDIRSATTFVRSLAGGPTSVVGLRLGATLAALASSECEIEHFVAWAPVLSGRRYLREQKALAEVSGASREQNSDYLDAGGFVLTTETAAHLGSLDLVNQGCRIQGEALVAEADAGAGGQGLAERLQRDGIATEVFEASGYAAMMQKPHLSVVPDETIGVIVRWLAARAGPPSAGAWRLPAETTAVSMQRGVRTTEEMVFVSGTPPLFGVLTRPLSSQCGERPLLLLANGGSVHNVGPNRLYVEVARELAAAGISTLRLDLQNLGDSIRGHPSEENHPYPSTAVADISRAIDWLAEARGMDRVVLGGLCSGAYHAFRCGVELPQTSIEGMLLINPLTFRWSEENAAELFGSPAPHASLGDAKKWRKLMRGEYDVVRLLRFAAGASGARVRAAASRGLDRLGLLPPRWLDQELLRCAAANRRIDFVYSRHDAGYGLLRASTGRALGRLETSGVLSLSFVEGADHSFSRRAWRENLSSLISARLSPYLQEAPTNAYRSGSADLNRPESCRSSMDRAFATASS